MHIGTNSFLSSNMISVAIKRNFADLDQALARLSSGRRINSAADDPAGLIISERLRGRIGSLNREIENVQMSIGKYETVGHQIMDLRSQLNEMRSLAVGAANGAFNSEDTQRAYQDAADSLVANYNRAVANAEYNGRHTLDGSEGALANIASLTDIDLSNPEMAAETIDRIDAAAREIDAAMMDVGSTQKFDLESQLSSLMIERQNLVAAESQLADTDYAQEYANYIGTLIRTKASVALLSHSFLTGQSVLDLFGR
ncbi:MAG: hypothetical protein KKA42_06200 [candidate division Zixibacteria bacterium]|nr:hypothetical protein [candidate division Zixibacteria bacterium]